MKVAVLGAGITGLTAGWKLAWSGHEVRLFEAAPRAGGVIASEAVDGWKIEHGPVSFQESHPEVADLIGRLGLTAERITPDARAEHRYIARGKGLKALPPPSSVASFVSTPLLSIRSKLVVASEPGRKPVERTEDLSVADLVRDHFTSDILETLVQPLISGICAGDAEKLSVRHGFPKVWEAERTTGSLIKAATAAAQQRKAEGLPAAPPLLSFRSGLEALPRAIIAQLPKRALVLGARVTAALRGPHGGWQVEYVGAGRPESYACDTVLCALPAEALAGLELGARGQRPLEGLRAIEYSSLAKLYLGYRRDQVRHPLDGFGALVPAAERRTALGIVFLSSLFPDRAPAGHVALDVFVGGSLQPALAALPEAELIARVGADLRELVGAEGPPVFARRHPWPRAIPQYNLGYGQHLEAMARCEEALPGCHIGGSVRDGIALPECIRSGLRLAERVS
jgi:oxygen-dependent protoporphyrinogen oxidase